MSNEVSLRVKSPVTQKEDEIAELFFGDDQGKLLYFLGSDSKFLKSGNDAFDLMLDKYSDHPMSVYAALQKGINAGRDFKSITKENEITVRPFDPDLNEKMISQVISKATSEVVLDNISLGMAMNSMAICQKSKGDKKKAKKVLDDKIKIFQGKGLKTEVLSLIHDENKALI